MKAWPFRKYESVGRLAAGLIPAAALTFGLFVAMDRLVDVGEVKLSEVELRPMASIVLPPEKADVLVRDRKPPEKLPDVVPPKTRAVTRQNPGEIVFDFAVFESPVSDLPIGVTEQVYQPVSIIGRERALAVRAPVPDYPQAALRRGLEGECEVVFSVDAAGRPYSASATCTDKIFVRSSETAVERALFAARTKNGVPVGQENLVYPIHFTLND
ncbi:MAG: hypothetical protein CMK06_11610 [Ponticaulis sp.]|nr:hypothetical protein [Ponticaulis sp.]|tara:strand:- start:1454 stop:2095 length:642 start_codon:yes stop_codon:yes gene_type:complete